MTISTENMQHGAAVLQLLNKISDTNPNININWIKSDKKASYQLTFSKKKTSLFERKTSVNLALYFKASQSRLSPWGYSFKKNHQIEIERLNDQSDELFLIFINHDDGIACIDYQQLKSILDDNFEAAEWVSISRKLRQAYRISGRDGKLSSALPRNNFPKAIADFIFSKL